MTFRDRPVSISSPNSRQSFSDLVICGLCGYKFNTPKMLSCQHTFCLSCLKTDAQKKTPASNYECPTCKIKAPIANFSELPNNLHVDTLLEILDPKIGDRHRPLSLVSSSKYTARVGTPESDSIGTQLINTSDG